MQTLSLDSNDHNYMTYAGENNDYIPSFSPNNQIQYNQALPGPSSTRNNNNQLQHHFFPS